MLSALTTRHAVRNRWGFAARRSFAACSLTAMVLLLSPATLLLATPSESDQLKKENQELRDKLQQYRALEEDLAAQRVAEKAEKQIKIWISLGGAAILLVAAVGFKWVKDYTRDLVTKKLDAVAAEHIESVIQSEGQRQMAAIVERHEAEIQLFAKQRIDQIITATNPIGAQAVSAPDVPVKAGQIDYASEMQTVRSQGGEGSVIGFATAYALEYQLWKKRHEKVRLSPRYIYYEARKKARGDISMDSGALFRDALAILKTKGAVPEAAWPYKSGEYMNEPPPDVEQALRYKIKSYSRLRNIDEIKSSLQENGPVVSGVTLYGSAMSDETAKNGRLPPAVASDHVLGGHALCLVGYNDERRELKFINSWGEDWGDHGYGYMPYDYADRFVTESWAITV
jgi:C1A family cysteine protease